MLETYFKDLPLGLFRYKGLVYTKINNTQGVLITSGKIVNFNPNDLCWNFS